MTLRIPTRVRPTASRGKARRSGTLTAAGVLAILAALGATVVPATGAAASPAPAPHRSCSLASATVTTSATPDVFRDRLFTRYGDAGGNPSEHGSGWSGADSTYSAPISGGRTVWVYSDTFLGPVAADGSRPADSPFLHNSLVVQQGTHLTTIHGGTAAHPKSLVGPTSGPTDGTSWYWFGAATPRASGRLLDVIVLHFVKTGDGPFDFAWRGTGVVTFDTRTWRHSAIHPLPSSTAVQWSAWTQPYGRDLLVYGVEDLDSAKYLHLARVAGGNLADAAAWRYWTGSRWSTREADSARLLDGVANELSVTPFRDGWLLVSFDTATAFSPDIHGYVACSPAGPFRDIGVLYSAPEVGASGTYHNGNVYAYNAHVHPELARPVRGGERIELTYNVNSFGLADVYDDASIYRARHLVLTVRATR